MGVETSIFQPPRSLCVSVPSRIYLGSARPLRTFFQPCRTTSPAKQHRIMQSPCCGTRTLIAFLCNRPHCRSWTVWPAPLLEALKFVVINLVVAFSSSYLVAERYTARILKRKVRTEAEEWWNARGLWHAHLRDSASPVMHVWVLRGTVAGKRR